MPATRKIIAKLVLYTGVLLGLGALTLWAHVMWPVVAAEPVRRNALWVIILGGFALLGLVVWPFAWVAERIDPPPPQPGNADGPTPPKAGLRSRLSRSKTSRRPKQE